MWRMCFLLLLIVPGLPCAAQAPVPAHRSGLGRDETVLEGVLALDIAAALDPPAQEWVLADITPGEWRVPGSVAPYLFSGMGVPEPDGSDGIRVIGSLTVRRLLTPPKWPGGRAIGTEGYDWTQSGQPGLLVYRDPVVPFVVGGLTACRVHPDQQGAARYAPASLIPPAWAPDLVAAFGYCRSHAALFRAPAPGAAPPPDTLSHLRGLLADRNPFLEAQAVRALASVSPKPGGPALSGPDADALARQAVAARGMRQALLTALIFRYAPPPDNGAAVGTLLRAVRAATDPRQVVGMELAKYTATRPATGSEMIGNGAGRSDLFALFRQLGLEKAALADGAPVSNIYPRVGGLTDGISRADAYKYVALIADHDGF